MEFDTNPGLTLAPTQTPSINGRSLGHFTFIRR